MEYSELRSLIIAVLAFCVPIVAAIADKRAKAKKRSPQVNAEPIDFEELERRRAALRRSSATDAVPEPVEGRVIEGAALRRSSATAAVPEPVEGQPALVKPAGRGATVEGQPALAKSRPAPKQTKEAQSGQYPTAEEIRKDCKKIILYSEILKPKFDERD